MDILLIIPRYSLTDKTSYNYNSPLGLAYISAAIKTKGYKVDILNLNHRDGKIEDTVLKHLDSKHYDLAYTGGNGLTYAVIEQIITSAREQRTIIASLIAFSPMVSNWYAGTVICVFLY